MSRLKARKPAFIMFYVPVVNLDNQPLMPTFVGGTSRNRISLRNIADGKIMGQYFKVEDCKFLTYNSWTFAY